MKKKYLKNLLILIFNIMLYNFNTLCYSVAIYENQTTSNQNQIPSLASMLEKVLPAVVSIQVSGSTKVQNQQLPEEFKFFFGPNLPPQQSIRPFKGLGSGIVIDSEKGYILTNNHVIDNANIIQVQFYDGKESEVKIIGKDPQTDIALLKIKNFKKISFKKSNLTAIKISDSDKLRVGDFAVAIGNPFGLGQTATLGIISALGRSGLNIEGLENFIQTDASINRGNSGGALVNLNGELIGINTAILSPEGGNIGIGFAIPSNMAKFLIDQIIKTGVVKRGLLGIKGTEMNADLAKALKIDAQKGAFVSEIIPNSAAEKSNIQSGDVIVSINNKKIHSFSELRAKIGTSEVGKKIPIGILRKGKLIKTHVILEDINSVYEKNKTIKTSLIGAILSNSEIHGKKGVKVNNVSSNSISSIIGLKEGDLIIRVNEKRTKNINQLKKIIEKKPNTLAINIIRGNQKIYLLFRGNNNIIN